MYHPVSFLETKSRPNSKFSKNHPKNRDTFSWKEREVGKSEDEKSQVKLERTERSWKVSLKLESFFLSWIEPSEVVKNRVKLERTERSWKESSEVGKNRAKLESFI